MPEEQQQNFLDNYTYHTPYSIDVFRFNNPEDIEQYMNRFRKLPEKINFLVFDFSSAEFIQDVLVPTFNLSPRQGEDVTKIIRDVLLCYIFVVDMAKEVQNRLSVN